MSMKAAALSALTLILASGSAFAQLAGRDDGEAAATLRLLTEHTSVAPGGETWLAIEFDIAPEWHIYWPGQNDAGYAPVVEWTVPEGVHIGELQWPTPHRYTLPGGILDHVFEGRVVSLARLTAPESLATGQTLAVGVHVAWLECAEGCVPRETDLETSLSVAAGSASPSSDASVIAEAIARLPRPGVGNVRVEWAGTERVTLTPTAANADKIARVSFYPHESGAPVTDRLASGEVEGRSITLRLKRGATDPLRGIIEAFDTDGRSLGAWLVETTPDDAQSDQKSAGDSIPKGREDR